MSLRKPASQHIINDRSFARNILWFAPLLYEFEMLPIDRNGRMDLVSSAFVASGTVELMQVTNSVSPLPRH